MRTIQQPKAKPDGRWRSSFLDSLRRDDLSPVTVRGYRYDLDQFLAWFAEAKGGTLRFEKLTVIDLINYRQYLVNVQALKPATVNRRLEALRRLCRWAYQTKRLKKNITQELKPMRTVRNIRPAGLTEPEVHALLRVAGESGHGLAARNYALCQLLLQTGLRVSEVAALHISDITVHERSGTVRVRQGKGMKAREVALNSTARRALRLYLDGRGEHKAEDAFFLSDRGVPMPIRTIQSVITQLARRAKITRVLQLNRGESRHDLAKWLFFANRGEFRTGDYEEIMNKASCLSLLSNAVLVWNTIEMAKIVERLRASGEEVATADLAKVSPMAFHHVIPNGTYHFREAKRGDDIAYNALE